MQISGLFQISLQSLSLVVPEIIYLALDLLAKLTCFM
jgi:hypothetical protein